VVCSPDLRRYPGAGGRFRNVSRRHRCGRRVFRISAATAPSDRICSCRSRWTSRSAGFADPPRAPNAQITRARSDRSRKYVTSTANERATAGVADVRVKVGRACLVRFPAVSGSRHGPDEAWGGEGSADPASRVVGPSSPGARMALRRSDRLRRARDHPEFPPSGSPMAPRADGSCARLGGRAIGRSRMSGGEPRGAMWVGRYLARMLPAARSAPQRSTSSRGSSSDVGTPEGPGARM
jgi:hypothetical protein